MSKGSWMGDGWWDGEENGHARPWYKDIWENMEAI